MRTLHTHQERGIELLRASLATGHKRPMLASPTGSGKTVLAGAIVERALRKGKRLIFTVPALSLVDQTVESFWAEGFREIGVLQGNHPLTNPSMPVQVASVQTLQKRLIPRADLVLIDEAHRWFDFYAKWMADPEWADVPFIGLSATPWTKGLGKHYDDLLVVTTTEELIEHGFLSKFRVFAPSHPDLTGVRTVAGDYHEGELSGAMQKGTLVADAITTWLQKAEGRPTLCFAVDRAHAQLLQERFIAAGVPTGYVDAFTTREEREVIRKKFHTGALKVVCNVGCLTTGIDWDVRCLSLCRPTKSEMLYVQIVGRGLRTADGKDDCLILDHSDTTLRLGFVTDVHYDKLHDGKTKASSSKSQPDKKPLPKECASCGTLRTPGLKSCTSCGHTPKKISTQTFAEGTLAEMTGKSFDRDTKQRWFSMLHGIALERGYKAGWVAHSYKRKFHVWPTRLSDEPIPPSPEVRSYVRHLMIAHVRRAAA